MGLKKIDSHHDGDDKFISKARVMCVHLLTRNLLLFSNIFCQEGVNLGYLKKKRGDAAVSSVRGSTGRQC